MDSTYHSMMQSRGGHLSARQRDQGRPLVRSNLQPLSQLLCDVNGQFVLNEDGQAMRNRNGCRHGSAGGQRWWRLWLTLLLLALNGVTATAVWPSQLGRHRARCVPMVYRPGREVRFCLKPISSNDVQPGRSLPLYRRSPPNSLEVQVVERDRQGGSVHGLLTLALPPSLLKLYALAVGLVGTLVLARFRVFDMQDVCGSVK